MSSDVVTGALAIWGAVLGTLAALLHAARFVWDRPRLAIRVNRGFLARPRRGGVELPIPFGFGPDDYIVFLDATKLGRGSMTINVGGFRFADGSAHILTRATRELPAKLDESDSVSLMCLYDGLVAALANCQATTVKHAFFRTSDDRQHTKSLHRALRKELEQKARAYGEPS